MPLTDNLVKALCQIVNGQPVDDLDTLVQEAHIDSNREGVDEEADVVNAAYRINDFCNGQAYKRHPFMSDEDSFKEDLETIHQVLENYEGVQRVIVKLPPEFGAVVAYLIQEAEERTTPVTSPVLN